MIKRVLRLAGIAGIAAGIVLAPTQTAFASPVTSAHSAYVQSGGVPRPPAPRPVVPAPKPAAPAPRPAAPAPRPAPKAPSVPSTGRNVQPPKAAPKNNVPTGRAVQAPSGTGNKQPAATSGKVTIPSTARASGHSYTDGGHTYTYSRTTYQHYYTTYHGGYPVYGTVLYWQLLNDPFYYPNYGNVLSPWYGHGYPSGYVVSNGQFVATSTPASSFWTAFWIILIFVLIGLVIWFVLRRRSGRSSQSARHFGDDI